MPIDPTTGADKMLAAPMIEWRRRAGSLTPSERQKIARTLSSIGIQAIRAAAYLESVEPYPGCTDLSDAAHADAVKRQNTTARKVRRALGYTYPNSPITF